MACQFSRREGHRAWSFTGISRGAYKGLCRSIAVMLDLGGRIGEHFVTCNWIVDSSETKSIGQLSQSYVGEGPTSKRIGRAIPRYDRRCPGHARRRQPEIRGVLRKILRNWNDQLRGESPRRALAGTCGLCVVNSVHVATSKKYRHESLLGCGSTLKGSNFPRSCGLLFGGLCSISPIMRET